MTTYYSIGIEQKGGGVPIETFKQNRRRPDLTMQTLRSILTL